MEFLLILRALIILLFLVKGVERYGQNKNYVFLCQARGSGRTYRKSQEPESASGETN